MDEKQGNRRVNGDVERTSPVVGRIVETPRNPNECCGPPPSENRCEKHNVQSCIRSQGPPSKGDPTKTDPLREFLSERKRSGEMMSSPSALVATPIGNDCCHSRSCDLVAQGLQNLSFIRPR